jgi:hypothetical protein
MGGRYSITIMGARPVRAETSDGREKAPCMRSCTAASVIAVVIAIFGDLNKLAGLTWLSQDAPGQWPGVWKGILWTPNYRSSRREHRRSYSVIMAGGRHHRNGGIGAP